MCGVTLARMLRSARCEVMGEARAVGSQSLHPGAPSRAWPRGRQGSVTLAAPALSKNQICVGGNSREEPAEVYKSLSCSSGVAHGVDRHLWP